MTLNINTSNQYLVLLLIFELFVFEIKVLSRLCVDDITG
jgi:hypothetical protein